MYFLIVLIFLSMIAEVVNERFRQQKQVLHFFIQRCLLLHDKHGLLKLMGTHKTLFLSCMAFVLSRSLQKIEIVLKIYIFFCKFCLLFYLLMILCEGWFLFTIWSPCKLFKSQQNNLTLESGSRPHHLIFLTLSFIYASGAELIFYYFSIIQQRLYFRTQQALKQLRVSKIT